MGKGRGRKAPEGARRKRPARSGFEHRVGERLTALGYKWKHEPYKLPYYDGVVGGSCGDCGSKKVLKKRHYLPDYVLEDETIIEAKGRFTSTDRTKMLAIQEEYGPHRRIVMVFMRDDWTSKKHSMRYSDWCEKHGIEYRVGEGFEL